MAESLQTLIRLARHDLDKIARHLAEKTRELEDLESQKRDLLEQMAQEQAFSAQADAPIRLSYGRYAAFVSERREQLDDQIEQMTQQIAVIQEALAAAYRTLKTYEESLRLREEQERAEEERKDRIELDEVGLTAHRRKVH